MKDVTRYEWDKYREVQKNGLYNMLSAEAIRMSGLDKDTYFDIVENYNTYYEKFEGGKDE